MAPALAVAGGLTAAAINLVMGVAMAAIEDEVEGDPLIGLIPTAVLEDEVAAIIAVVVIEEAGGDRRGQNEARRGYIRRMKRTSAAAIHCKRTKRVHNK